MKQVVGAVVFSAMVLTATLGAGFVLHGLWLVFLYGWDTIPR
jgi:hypothetical protein